MSDHGDQIICLVEESYDENGSFFEVEDVLPVRSGKTVVVPKTSDKRVGAEENEIPNLYPGASA
jgi:hypothetical protein